MRKTWITKFLCLIGVAGFLQNAAAKTDLPKKSDCTSGWEEFSPFQHPTFLDTAVTYWRYQVEIPSGGKMALRIQGEFPHARYTSFAIYDQVSKDWIQYGGYHSALADVQIRPDRGSSNPFVAGIRRSVKSRNYTIDALPPNVAPLPSARNFLVLPDTHASGKPSAIEIWYRIYLPDHSTFSKGQTGNVALPRISAYDPKTGDPISCPLKKTTEFEMSSGRKNLPPPPLRDGTMQFYRRNGAGMYPNQHTDYVAATLQFSRFFGGWEVAVVRLKPPTFFKTLSGQSPFSGSEEVRYWSFCLGTPSTMTMGCLADEQLKIGSDGYVNLVVGEPELEEEVTKAGLNFLSKKKLLFAFLIYRNLSASPSWKYSISHVPVWRSPLETDEDLPDDAEERMEASHFLGEHSPQGKQCDLETFRKNYCGVKVSFPAGSTIR